MGIKQSTQVECEDWRETQWEGVAEKQRNFGRWRTLRNRRTGAMADEYQLSWLSQHQYNFYLKSFNWRNRRKNQSPIVNSIFLKQICKGEICSGKYAANVYLQHISLRLSQIEEIPISDALFILIESLQGFSQLYQHSGYFKIHEQQIGFDRGGKVKVWVNSDLSKNYPECDAECGHRDKDQIDMVEQLISIINTATDQEEFPQPNIEQYFDMVRKRQVLQIGFQYAKIVAMEYARINQIRLSNRFDAVVDLFGTTLPQTTKPYQSTHPMSTLPSSQTIIMQPQFHNYQPRLNNCYSMPNINSISNNYSTMSYQPPPQYYQQPVERPESYQYSNQYYPQEIQNQHYQIPRIPRLSEINYSQFGEPSVQTKRKSRNSKTSKNSKSQMVGIQQTTQNQSLHFNESHADERNTMKSMPLRNPYSTHRDRFGNNQRIRYSQCDQQIFSQNDFQHRKPFNHDAFGLVTPANRRMKQSNSSYRIGSSNSSQSKHYKNSFKNQKYSKNSGSSRRESVRNERSRQYQKKECQIAAIEMARPQLKYGNLTQEWQLDPQIEADIRKYLG